MIENNIHLEQEHPATGLKFFLASMEEKHIKHLIALAKDSSLIDLLGWNTFFEAGETEQFIQAISSCAFPYSRNSQPVALGIYLAPESFPIGYVVLKGLNRDLFTAEIGIAILDKKHRSKGYGRLALQRFIDYAFNELKIQTIGAVILCSNKKSITMFKKLNFLPNQIMHQSWAMPNGELVDILLMELKSTM